jgi:hypothetical protein
MPDIGACRQQGIGLIIALLSHDFAYNSSADQQDIVRDILLHSMIGKSHR